MPSRWSWGVLVALLVAVTASALTLDRSGWPSLLGDEATYLMQAESLAWDFDLVYSRSDYERFLDHHVRKPQGLILQSGDGGETITFGKPFFYAVYLAPFVRLSPSHGPVLANALLLALACVMAARVLDRHVGAHAPLLVATFVFASVTFVYVLWVHADLFLAGLTALAFGLALDPRPGGDEAPAWRSAGRWAVVGVFLAVAGFSRPLYLTLFLPAAVALRVRREITPRSGRRCIPSGRVARRLQSSALRTPRASPDGRLGSQEPEVISPRTLSRGERQRGLAALVAGAALLFVAAGAVHQALAGSWTGYGAERRGFYAHTGFPEVDFSGEAWERSLEDWGDHAWGDPASYLGGQRLHPALLGWNALYFLAGRHVGLLPYFLPVLLAFAGRPRGAARWSIVLAVGVSAAAFVVFRPFNFYGGGGSVGNRYFLPLYAALWYLPTRPVRLPWVAATSAAAALFLGPLWAHPHAYPLYSAERFPHVSPVAARLLPYETTQAHLKPLDRDDLYADLFVRFPDPSVRPAADGRLLRIRGGTPGTLLIGRAAPLERLHLEVRAPRGVRLELEGAEAEPLGRQAGWQRFRLRLGAPRARHPMWWTWDPVALHLLTLRFDGAGEGVLRFRLRADGDAATMAH